MGAGRAKSPLRVVKRRYGLQGGERLDACPRHGPEGMQRGTRQRVPLAKVVVSDTTHLAERVIFKPLLSDKLSDMPQRRGHEPVRWVT